MAYILDPIGTTPPKGGPKWGAKWGSPSGVWAFTRARVCIEVLVPAHYGVTQNPKSGISGFPRSQISPKWALLGPQYGPLRPWGWPFLSLLGHNETSQEGLYPLSHRDNPSGGVLSPI